MSDHVDNPLELIDPAPCDCCGVPSTYRRSSIWHGLGRICAPCFWIWYDPDWADSTKPEEIKAERLERYGTRDVPRTG